MFYRVPEGYVALKTEVATTICKKALEHIQQSRDKKLRHEVVRLCDKANNTTMRRLKRWLGIAVESYDAEELLRDRAKLDALRDSEMDDCIWSGTGDWMDEIGWALVTGRHCKSICEEVLAAPQAEMVYLAIDRWKLIQDWTTPGVEMEDGFE
jgi:hypothetical protein